jgi:hypothetical protein
MLSNHCFPVIVTLQLEDFQNSSRSARVSSTAFRRYMQKISHRIYFKYNILYKNYYHKCHNKIYLKIFINFILKNIFSTFYFAVCLFFYYRLLIHFVVCSVGINCCHHELLGAQTPTATRINLQ